MFQKGVLEKVHKKPIEAYEFKSHLVQMPEIMK